MKILHIAPTPFFADRGCHMRILGEVHQLMAQGHEIIIATYHNGRKVNNLNIKRIINIPWYNKLEAGGSWHKLYLDVLLLWLSIRIAKEFKPAAIHGHLHEGALIGWLVSLITSGRKIPVLFDVQGSLSGELETYGLLKNKNMLKYFFYAVEILICKLPDFFICSSIANTNFIKTSMKVPKHKIITLIDGIDPEFFSSNSIRVQEDIQHVKSSKKIVIYTGSLMKSKGIDFLLQAIPRIINNFNNVKFLIVGHPTEEYQNIAKEMKIDSYIDFKGKVNYFKLPEYLDIADVAVDPKFDQAGEGSGKIINYMGAGLPVVCFDTLNNRKFLGESGFFALPGNSRDLADKIVYVLKNENIATSAGKSNRERVIQKFTWKASAELLSSVYSKIVHHSN